MAILGREIATQRAYALYGARLGMNIATRERALHTTVQRPVYARNGQERIESIINSFVLIGIAQQLHLKFSTDIIVEREA